MLKLSVTALAFAFLSFAATARTASNAEIISRKILTIKKEAARKKSGTSKKKSTKKISSKSARSSSKKKSSKSKTNRSSAKYRKVAIKIDPFTRNMGSLVWPMEEGNIKTGFGPYKVGLLNVTGNNPGLTLEGTKDAEVKSAFEGVICGIFEVEGNKAVVVSHGNYLTVYGNLALVNVSVDDKIEAGASIGQAANNLEGKSEIEFLLMKKNQNIDPEPWLKKK